jgi:redox-regulated HSP33 family molecular chaperone
LPDDEKRDLADDDQIITVSCEFCKKDHKIKL